MYFAGLIAGLALSLSLYANNRFVVMSLPFLICVVSGRLVTYASNPIIRGLAIQKVFYVPQSSPTTLVSFMYIVCCACYMWLCTFYSKGRENGCFIMTDYLVKRERKELQSLSA